MQGSRPFRIETVRGTPIRVYGRTFTPVARIASLAQHQGTIRQQQVEGTGWGMAYIRPLTIIEAKAPLAQDGDVRTMPIPDTTATVLRQMAVMALVIPAMCMVVAGIARWIRNR